MKRPFNGTLDVWAILLAQKPCYPEEAHFLAPTPTGWPARAGDILDAARECLLELNWSIDDARALCPAQRRTWDVSISTAVMAHANEERRKVGLDSLLSHHRSGTSQKRYYLGELLMIDGSQLHTANTLFTGKGPEWFRVLEEALAVTPQNRRVPKVWEVATHLGMFQSSPDGHATHWRTIERVDTALQFLSCDPDFSTDSIAFRRQQTRYALAHGITYESCSDGTGGGRAPGFAWQVTVNTMQPDAALRREVGCAIGLNRSDTAELAGLLRQLQCAPDQRGVRICSDCLGVLLMIERARRGRAQTTLRHGQRALLREFLNWEDRREFPVQLGWVRGHTQRKILPYTIQRWCDEMAPTMAAEAVPPAISQFDGRFVLTDAGNAPILGGWKEAALKAGAALMYNRLATDPSQEATPRGEVLWHRLRAFFTVSEWDTLALIGKCSKGAKLRFNAEADTITDPQGERWTIEQEARQDNRLNELRRDCHLCQRNITGAREAHTVSHCTAHAQLRLEPDTVAVTAWAQEVAWDYEELQDLIVPHMPVWRSLLQGGTWHGFTLQHRAPRVTGDAIGLSALDSMDGEPEPDVLPPNEVHPRSVKWAEDHPIAAAEAKATRGMGRSRIPLMVATSNDACKVIPAKLFELWNSWKGDAEDFEPAVIALLQREAERHGTMKIETKGFDDFWAWWGGFAAWCRRHVGKLCEGFTGPLNRTGPLAGGYSIVEDDELWQLGYDAWESKGKPRTWLADGDYAALLGNPPYSLRDVGRFCLYAQKAAGPIIGILPASVGRLKITPYVENTGGEILATFRAGTCAFIPFSFWTGATTRGKADNRRMVKQIIMAGWRLPAVTRAARREFITLAQSASNSLEPVVERGSLAGEPRYISRQLAAINSRHDNVQRPGMRAKEVMRQQKIATRLALLTEKQRKAREVAVERRRARQERGPLDVTALTGPSGPWNSLCWWKTQPAWLEMPADVDVQTWQRMIRWGMVPKDFDNLLMFAGMEQEARRLMCGKIGRSLRDAAVNCLWHAQSLTPRAPTARRDITGERNRAVITGDRGNWKGTTAGGAKLTAQQLARHEAALQPARTKATNEAAALAELSRIPMTGVPATPKSGYFLRVKLGKTAGGHFVSASNSESSLQQFRKDVHIPLSRAWAKLPRWWSWSNERAVRDGSRFNGILRPIDGVCGSRADGIRCSRGGYRGLEGRIRCAPCRADDQTTETVECDVCGCAATDGIWDWVSLGRLDMVCGPCSKATMAQAPNQWCDCCGTNRATQATADGSASCRGCGDNFSQSEGWLARAQRLCKRAARRLGAPASRFTEESARGLWLWAAEQWALDSGTDFCGNAITWNCICSTVLEWMRMHGIKADTPFLHAEHDGTDAAWRIQQTVNTAITKAQRTLLDFGFQGRAISITRPVFPRLSMASAQHTAPPRFHPLVADRTSLQARTQQKSRRAVRSTVSVPRQWQAALAPGPTGTQTTPTTRGGGRDRTAQLANDASQTRSGAFAPAVDGRPRPLAKPSVTHGSAAGGQGGGIQVQYRQPARTAKGSRVTGNRAQRSQLPSTTMWSSPRHAAIAKIATALMAHHTEVSQHSEDRGGKISKDRHVTRPPE